MKTEENFKHKNTQAHVPLTARAMMSSHIMQPGKLHWHLWENESEKANNILELLRK